MFDMKNLSRLKKLDENAPETMKALWAFDREFSKQKWRRVPGGAAMKEL
jgi:hypothetical protein